MSEMNASLGLELRQEMHPALRRFVGESEAARKTRWFAECVAPADNPLLLLGESGVGKGLLAKMIHDMGSRPGPFVPVDCGTISEALMAAELFGHTRGAFTGADRSRIGLVQEAEGGTLFLDEIGNMGKGAQAGLLRILDEEPLRPIGGGTAFLPQTRVIAATNADLWRLVEDGEFREDLLFRLSGIVFPISPLRMRKEDIPALLEASLKKGTERITPAALEVLAEYPWPGNVRQLVNKVGAAMVLHEGEISGQDMRAHMKFALENVPATTAVPSQVVFPLQLPTWYELEVMYFRHLVTIYRGDLPRAAEIAGMGLKTLYNKINRNGLRELALTGHKKSRF